MAKTLGVQHNVLSSNLKSIGFYDNTVRVEFLRGATYEYSPCTEKEFQEAFVPGVILKDWFAKFKTGKNFKQI